MCWNGNGWEWEWEWLDRSGKGTGTKKSFPHTSNVKRPQASHLSIRTKRKLFLISYLTYSWVKCFTVLTRDPRDPFTFVDHLTHDPWPADWPIVCSGLWRRIQEWTANHNSRHMSVNNIWRRLQSLRDVTDDALNWLATVT